MWYALIRVLHFVWYALVCMIQNCVVVTLCYALYACYAPFSHTQIKLGRDKITHNMAY